VIDDNDEHPEKKVLLKKEENLNQKKKIFKEKVE
jgi:hypothetical protein